MNNTVIGLVAGLLAGAGRHHRRLRRLRLRACCSAGSGLAIGAHRDGHVDLGALLGRGRG